MTPQNVELTVAPGDDMRPRIQRMLSSPGWAIAGTILMGLLALAPIGVSRAAITLPLLVLLPGHALLLALREPDLGLAAAGRLCLRVALSFSILILTLVGFGSMVRLTHGIVIAAVSYATFTAAAVAGIRGGSDRDLHSGGQVWTQSGVMMTGLGLITALVVLGGISFLPETTPDNYTRLSVSGETLRAETPLVVQTNVAGAQLELENGDDKAHTFGLVSAIDGGLQWESVRTRVEAHETWKTTVKGRIPDDACVVRLRVSVTKDGKPSGLNPLILYFRNEAGKACR